MVKGENMKDESDKIDKFIQFLWKLDRKGFAELRRSLRTSPGLDMKAVPYVETFAATEKTIWNQEMYYLIAGLFCLVERSLEQNENIPPPVQKNLGESIVELYLDKEKSGSIEQRFVRLLDADDEQLPHRLRQMITLIHSNKIAIGWEKLLGDLRFWKTDKRYVQHRWARSFYMKAT
jgi:CRISPR system Cascade subunit CasB